MWGGYVDVDPRAGLDVLVHDQLGNRLVDAVGQRLTRRL